MSKNKLGLAKRQHYIPIGLLENFVNADGKLFEVLFPERRIFPTTPENTMSARFVYEDDALQPNTIENFFGRLENEFIPLVRDQLLPTLQNAATGTSVESAEKMIRRLLPFYLLSYYRSGALLTEYGSMDVKDRVPLLTKKILNPYYVQQLSLMIQSRYKYAILRSSQQFLLCDQFVSTAALRFKQPFSNVSNRHMGLEDTLILLPISADYYACYWHGNVRFFAEEGVVNDLNEAQREAVNQVIINNSYRKCVASMESSIDAVLKGYRMEYPSQTYMGFNSGHTIGAINKKEVFFYEVDREAYDIFLHDPELMYKLKQSGRNDPCPCGIGKKFKRCHENVYKRLIRPLDDMNSGRRNERTAYQIHGAERIEAPIDQW